MTMPPAPTDKLDAATNVAVNGPADEPPSEWIVRPHAIGPSTACLSRVLGNRHALVLRGARHSNVPGLPVQSGKQSVEHHRRCSGAAAPTHVLRRLARCRTGRHQVSSISNSVSSSSISNATFSALVGDLRYEPRPAALRHDVIARSQLVRDFV
jgi:hypothetical protein